MHEFPRAKRKLNVTMGSIGIKTQYGNRIQRMVSAGSCIKTGEFPCIGHCKVTKSYSDRNIKRNTSWRILESLQLLHILNIHSWNIRKRGK